MPLLERQRLKALATDIDRAPEEVREALETINATAAEKSHGYVSKGCWVSSLVADGRVRRFAALNVGERDGAIRQLLSGFDLTDWLKKNLQAAPGQELSVVQVAGMIAGPGDGVPLPPPEGDPRRFVLSGSSVSGVLRLPSGQHCAAIEIAQLDCVIVKRRNEASRVPFARIQLSDMQIGADFPRPKRPWASFRPAFAIDGVAVPRGWGYSVGHWIEGGVLHVEIPRASGSVRGLAFLGDDDELAISLVSGCELAWKPSEDGLTATLEADVLWRTRLHGTHG